MKPWAKSTNKERADVANGICACPTHDSAFDSGLLTVTADLQIQSAAVLDTHTFGNDSLHKAFGTVGMTSWLLVPGSAAKPGSEYLTFHRSYVFRR